ncbi:structural protein sp46 precursor [Bacillus phage vB_BpuM-BpSp]|nr:structural protein sp46 precursor [Bacillus phage vB_BpuM-BpSp]
MTNFKSYGDLMANRKDEGFNQIFKEAESYFKTNQQVNILGEGFKEIVSDQQLFNDYATHLTEGMDSAQETAEMLTLMENTRMAILQEAATGSIPGLTSLAIPTVRRMWAKIALKYAVPTQPVDKPTFSVTFNRPYILDNVTREKRYLPDALRDNKNGLAEIPKIKGDAYELPLNKYDLLADVGASFQTGDSLDRQFFLKSVIVKAESADKDDAKAEEKEVVLNSKSSIDNKLYADVKVTHTDGTVTTDTVLGHVDHERGTVSVTSFTGAVKSVKFLGYVSAESHNRSTQVSFEIERRDLSVGTGEHIEASLPLEMLQDTMALYNIDGANEVMDVMSNVTAQKVDQEIYNFLERTFEANPKYRGEFNVHPAPQFAGNPKEWLEEIKRVIDHYATKIVSEAYYREGFYVIVGNPQDTQIIPNVTWQFQRTTDQSNGIDVEYSIGALGGSNNRYTIVASDLIPQGKLTMFFVPLNDKFLTIKYFPYSFNVVKGGEYRNTMAPNIPSIMMTKRQTIESFIPLICEIEIKNNNGSLFNPNYGFQK